MRGLKSHHCIEQVPVIYVPTLADLYHMIYFKVLSVVTIPTHTCIFYVAVSLAMCMSKRFEEHLIIS